MSKKATNMIKICKIMHSMEKVDRDVHRVRYDSKNGGRNSGNVAVISDNDFVIYR